MSLNVFDNRAADQEVSANLARDLPAQFSESWDVSTRAMLQWHSGFAFNIARASAMDRYRDDIQQKTGELLPQLGAHSEGNELNDFVSIDDFNAAQSKLKEKYPGLDYLTPLTDADVDNMAYKRMAKVHSAAADLALREKTFGGMAGNVIGTLAGGLADPVTVLTLPLGGAGEAGILLRALEFAGVSGGTEAINAGLNFKSHEAAVPGSSHEIPGEIASAAAGGALLGGAFGLLHKVLGFGAKPLPTSVRDEVNAASSEFQFNATNPFPTAAGDAAARDATVDATMAMIRDLPVRSGDSFDIAHVHDLAASVAAKNPEEIALAGEKHLRPETFGEKPEVQAFDRMPGETETAADYWDKRLQTATAEERQALGATDVAASDVSREQIAHLATEPATQDAVLHNLDHVVQANPEMEFTRQVRQPDGSFQFETRKLSEVLGELDGWETAAKEIEACAVGGALEMA